MKCPKEANDAEETATPKAGTGFSPENAKFGEIDPRQRLKMSAQNRRKRIFLRNTTSKTA